MMLWAGVLEPIIQVLVKAECFFVRGDDLYVMLRGTTVLKLFLAYYYLHKQC